MKKIILSLLIVFSCTIIIAQSYTDEKGKKHLWGNVDFKDFEKKEYAEWYKKYSDDYTPVLNSKDGEKLQDVNVKIFLGTWCGDTKFLLPKFMEEWESMNLNISNVEFIGLHNKDGNYKQGPKKETVGYNIHRVPTFIFYKDEKEIGRIVERSVFSLDRDILAIASEQSYEERYQGQKIMNDFLCSYEGDSLLHKKNINDVYRKIRREVSSSGELNAFGYALKAQGEMEKAEFVFLLNKYMFPYEPNVRDSYGEYLLEVGRLDEAKNEYEEVIRLKGSDKNAVKQLNKIYILISENDSAKT